MNHFCPLPPLCSCCIACSPIIQKEVRVLYLFEIFPTEPIAQSPYCSLFQDLGMNISGPSGFSFSSSNTYLPILYFICIDHSSQRLRRMFEAASGPQGKLPASPSPPSARPAVPGPHARFPSAPRGGALRPGLGTTHLPLHVTKKSKC